MMWTTRKRTWFGAPWTFTIYSFDEERFYLKTGVFTQNNDEVRLYRVMDISYSRTLMQRIFGLGTISIKSSDRSLGNFQIENIKDVDMVKETLSDLVEKQRRTHGVRSREYFSGSECDCDDCN